MYSPMLSEPRESRDAKKLFHILKCIVLPLADFVQRRPVHPLGTWRPYVESAAALLEMKLGKRSWM